MKNEITWNGMRITLDYQPQPDNYGESVAWYSEGHDAEGNRYEVVWEYEDTDWDHPLEVNEQ